MDHRFFSEVPRIEELQDSNSSPRREEVAAKYMATVAFAHIQDEATIPSDQLGLA